MNKKKSPKTHTNNTKVPLNEGVDWLFCAKHKQNHPKGTMCPKCLVEPKRQV